MDTAYIEAAPGVRLWTEQRGDADAPALLLVMGAQAAGLGWPEPLVEALAKHHRVIRYDHRDTGRSTWSYEQAPYRIADLAGDVIAVLDGLGVERAHLVGMSLGGMLTQLVLADHPERVLSATLLGTCACSTTPYLAPDGARVPVEELPGVDPRILEEWARPVEDHGMEAELDRRVRHWKLLNGDRIPFDAEWFRELERGIIEHTGRYDTSGAHARADQSGLERTDALTATVVTTLSRSPTAEPVFPLPHPQHMAQVIKGARLVEMPGMGHALPRQVLGPLTDAILEHTLKA